MSDYEITGPYQYEKDAHPCFRIDSGREIIACVYVHDKDEETARKRAEAIVEGLRRIGRVGVTRDEIWSQSMTDATADAAKLLAKAIMDEWALEIPRRPTMVMPPFFLAEIAAFAALNARPQPAAPAGEPDFATVERVAEAIAMAGTSHFGDDTPYTQQDRLVKMMRRCEARAAIAAYGLAVRPKVEDGETTKAADTMRKEAGHAPRVQMRAQLFYWADLLERLQSRNKQLADYAADCGTASATATERAEAAEADLRTKEAQLAQADAVIVEMVAPPQSWQSKTLHETYRAACEHHQSRQQAATRDNPGEANEH